MKTETFYMHKNSMDLAMEILFINDEFKTIRWWNLGYTGKPWLVDGSKLTIRIYPDSYEDYVELDFDALVKPRKKSGIPR